MQYLAAVFLILAACGSVKATSDGGGGHDGGVADAPSSADACVPEADTTLCMQLGNACEVHMVADNCGMMRSVDCGGCSGGQGCVVGQCKTPVCTTFAYTSATLGAVSRASLEDSLESTTPDALVIVLEQEPAGAAGCGAGAGCANDSSGDTGGSLLMEPSLPLVGAKVTEPLGNGH